MKNNLEKRWSVSTAETVSKGNYVTPAHLDLPELLGAEAAEQNETKLADLCSAMQVCEARGAVSATAS